MPNDFSTPGKGTMVAKTIHPNPISIHTTRQYIHERQWLFEHKERDKVPICSIVYTTNKNIIFNKNTHTHNTKGDRL